MPITPNFSLWSPDDSDDWDLTIDLAAMAISIDAALIAGATRVIGTDAERLAATAPLLRTGLEFFVASTKVEWVWDGTIWVPTDAAVRLTKTTAQSTSPTPNTYTAVSWNVETFDVFDMHTSAQPTRITTSAQGLYSISAVVAATLFPSSGTSTLDTMLYVNGVKLESSLRSTLAGSGQVVVCSTSDTLRLNSGDYVEVFMASPLTTVVLRVQNCNFSVARIGF